ncbi:MAG: ABC transporter substrate-binding protein [Betaproteobacteria bacterium]
MKRRDAGLTLVLGTLAAAVPRIPFAQPAGRVVRLGYLSHPTRESVAPGVDAFVRRLRELGWIEGQNLVIEYRWAEGKTERLPALANDLVRRKVDLIVARAGVAAQAAKAATASIPIVMIFPFDPIGLGLVSDLRRPGGNVIGTTFAPGPEIVGKQLQILKETLPSLSRVAVLRNPADAGSVQYGEALAAAARRLGIQLRYVEARGPDEFDAAFETIARERAEAMITSGSSTYLVHRARLAELAAARKLPTMSSYREMVEGGMLMAYAVNMAGFVGRAAEYVDRILRGAKPADMPIEHPTRFELVINLKTARAIGIVIPPPVLQRADEVIG